MATKVEVIPFIKINFHNCGCLLLAGLRRPTPNNETLFMDPGALANSLSLLRAPDIPTPKNEAFFGGPGFGPR
jgi:hypothetical protein